MQSPTQSEESKGLSKLEVFGLTSGSIGLVADVISLSALFKLTSAGVEIPKSSWITPLILITYTGVIVGFYSRRILCYLNRGKAKEDRFTKQGYNRIEHASVVITSLIVGTLCLMFIYSAHQRVRQALEQDHSESVQKVNEKYEKLKAKAIPEEIEKLEQAKKTDIGRLTPTEANIFFLWSFASFLSGLLIMFINFLSRSIYKGCDINYQTI